MSRVKNFIKSLIRNKRAVPITKLSPIETLKHKGLKVGENFNMMFDVIIDNSHCWHISIGNNVTLAPRVHILAHDASTKIFLGYTRIGKVVIGDNVFIGASAIIMPGVTIGNDCIIGAGSVVSKDVENGSVVAGNPAKYIMSISAFLNKRKDEMTKAPIYSEAFTIEQNITSDMKLQMEMEMTNRFGYVV